MKKPKLKDYGLSGIDTRPRADFDASPASEQELADALESVILYAVETARVRKFRGDLRDWEWANVDTR